MQSLLCYYGKEPSLQHASGPSVKCNRAKADFDFTPGLKGYGRTWLCYKNRRKQSVESPCSRTPNN
ncbi:hypothetical protein DERF_012990 [Dermatophagoides farinae]|uniref:Uncharacterized protein n=1 Tax=Dermatophagoides farinae TaxID=6954 RepID=A0A922HQB8_DERFA|nr:hypothetical protein DERF_012990 [Dermatophagoides farinae]